MHIRTLLITTMIAGLAAPAFANNTQDFVTKASVSGMFEVQSSKLALDKAKNAEVKKFAKQMVVDHTKSTNELKAALKRSESGAEPATSLDEKHQSLLTKLKKADAGEEFEETYLEIQEDAHDEAVSLFTDYSEDGDDKVLKEFAAKTLPTLKKHLDHVEDLDDNL